MLKQMLVAWYSRKYYFSLLLHLLAISEWKLFLHQFYFQLKKIIVFLVKMNVEKCFFLWFYFSLPSSHNGKWPCRDRIQLPLIFITCQMARISSRASQPHRLFSVARPLASEKNLCVHYQSLRRQSVMRQWKHALHSLPFWPAVPILCQFITENGRLSFSLPTEVS